MRVQHVYNTWDNALNQFKDSLDAYAVDGGLDQDLISLLESAVWHDILTKYVTSLSQNHYAKSCISGLNHRLCHRGLTGG